ncbi:MAG: hypothetical protein WCI67_20730 [Chloroflexales bacterium]
MRVGTKSLLFGVHQVVLHPLLLACAWTKLYGFPRDRRLWVAFFVHDMGYWGCADMDGPEGKRHPALGGTIMARLYGKWWRDFTRLHSRSAASWEDAAPSALCAADKLVPAITPRWLHIALACASGEVAEYMREDAGWRGGAGQPARLVRRPAPGVARRGVPTGAADRVRPGDDVPRGLAWSGQLQSRTRNRKNAQ